MLSCWACPSSSHQPITSSYHISHWRKVVGVFCLSLMQRVRPSKACCACTVHLVIVLQHACKLPVLGGAMFAAGSLVMCRQWWLLWEDPVRRMCAVAAPLDAVS